MPIVIIDPTKDSFVKNLEKGKIGEKIFEELLRFLGIKFRNVTNDSQYRQMDIDYLAGLLRYEVKCNYKDDGFLLFEEIKDTVTSIPGWWYKSWSDIVAFASAVTRDLIFLEHSGEVKHLYDKIKDKYPTQEITCFDERFNRDRCSIIRRIPLAEFKGHYWFFTKQYGGRIV